MVTTLDSLAAGKYISLTTYRKDGTAVATPVWLVREGDALLVTTDGESGKAKRIRNNPAVLVATCDSRGRLKGEQVAATALIQSADQAARTAELVRRRYGLMGWILTRRRTATRVGIEIRLG